MAEQPNNPKSQFEISTGKPKKVNRALEVRRDNDNVKDESISILDIDSAVIEHIRNKIVPVINVNGTAFNVPVIYGTPERWASTQEQGFFKDKDGKIQIPLIMVRKTGMTRNRELSSKVDANNPNIYTTVTKQWSKKNAYTPFNILNKNFPILEQYNVVVPDFMTINYEMVIWTDFVEHMNRLIEAINYADDSYWGDPERYKFRVRIEDFSDLSDLNQSQQRIIKSSCNLTLAGYIVPNSINKQTSKPTKAFTNARIKFGTEIDGTNEIS
jgi:hypothetical protein